MEYNFREIGERIRELRKTKFNSQDDFADALRKKGLRISRNTISAIENGESEKFSLEFLLTCCKLFKCDIGYLMGEYGECRTRDGQFILEETGLSQLSVDRLMSKVSTPQNLFLDALVSSESYSEMDSVFYEYWAYILRCNKNTAWFANAEEKLKNMDPDSDEAALLHEEIGRSLMASGNLERTIYALEYQISLCFGEMLKSYRKSNLDTMERWT